MFAKVFDWFETRYSPVALAEDRQPPMGLWNFFRYFIMQFRAGFAMRMLFVAAGAIVDAMLPIDQPPPFLHEGCGRVQSTKPLTG